MKFLTLSSVKDVFFTLPPAVSRPLMEATLDQREQKKKEGVILETYELAGWKRWAAIYQHDPAEDLVKTLAT